MHTATRMKRLRERYWPYGYNTRKVLRGCLIMLEIEYKGKKVVMYTVEEVAKKTGEKPENVRKAIRNRELEATQFGKRYYVLEEKLPEPRSSSKLFTVKEIAEMFGVSQGVVRNEIREEWFDVVKKGSRVFIPEDSLEDIIAEGFPAKRPGPPAKTPGATRASPRNVPCPAEPPDE